MGLLFLSIDDILQNLLIKIEKPKLVLYTLPLISE